MIQPAGAAGPGAEGAPRRRLRRSDQAYDQIIRLILSGDFPRDCKLPTESELGLRLGMSRPVVREALARLRDEGYVRSQQGSGSFVLRGPEPRSLVYPPVRTVASLLHSYEFRITVEAETASLAAERHTPATLGDIRRVIDQAEAAIAAGGAPQIMRDLNFAFHRAVARATRNEFYVVTLESLPNLAGGASIQNFGYEDPVALMRAIHGEHLTVFRAIEERNGARARAEMLAHINNARRFVLERRTLA